MSGNAPFPKFHVLVLAAVLSVSGFQNPSGFSAVIDEKAAIESTVGSSDISDLPAAPSVSSLAVAVIGERLPGFQRNLRDIASNVTYKSKEDLKSVRPLTFQEAVKDVEGAIFYDQVGNGLDTTFSLRGFNNSSDTVFLLDGVRINEVDGAGINYPLISTMDLESIQIDRGSGSPVYGSNAFAGVVNLTSRRPNPKLYSLFGGFEWADHQGLRFNQGFSGTVPDKLTPLGGKWTYYFNGGRDVSEGFRDNDDWRITSFDVKTSYEFPEEQGKIYAGVKHFNTSVSNPGELTFQQFQDNQERTNKPLDGKKIKSTIVQTGIDKTFWDNRLLASVLASWRVNRIKSWNTFGTFTDFADGFNPDTNFSLIKNQEQDFTGQLEYKDEWGEIGSDAVFGIEFRNGRNLSLLRDAFNGLIVETTATETDRTAQPDNFALFWRETVSVFDKVIPYFGMRHDFHWMHTQDQITPTDNVRKHWTKSTLSAGMTVKPAEFADVFGNYSQGFRVPTVDEIAPFAGTISSTLEPEQTASYEAGTRIRIQDLSTTKFSYFLIDLEDEIVFDSTSVTAQAPFGRNINIGKSRRYGIELREDLKPVEELNLYTSYTWMRAYVRETDGGGTLIDGRSLGQIPENRFTVGGMLRPLVRLGEPWDGFRIGVNGIFTGRQHPTAYESTTQATLNATGGAGHFIKPYSVWDMTLYYSLKGIQVYFKIANIFDEKYYTRSVSATSFGTAIYPAGTYNFVNPGAPREYILGADWEFG